MGYYDPNKDYSLAIKQAKDSGASASEISRLQSERQNKIDAKYGGKDPYKGKSDIMGSGSSKGSSRDVEDAVKDTWDRVYSGGSKELTKGPGYVTGGYTPGAAYGTPMLADNPYYKNPVSGSGADMSRRPDLAGSYAVSNGYTVFYDEDGYAVKARKGVTDYTPHRDINAENGTYNQSGAWSDNEVLTAADRQRIQDIRARMQAGQLSGDEANRLANEIRSGYGYTIDKAGNVTDLGALSSVDARRRAWGLPTNDVSAEQQNFLQLMFPEQGTRDSGALLGSLYELNQGTYQPQGGGTAPNVSALGGSDLSAYLRDMYEQNIAAQQAALKSAYEQNVAAYEAQDDLIANAYQQQRNQAAGQNELQRLQMAEMGISHGLNTGATGQLALAQSAALQGSLADIGSAEATSRAENSLALKQLEAQYRNAVAQAMAEGNAQLASALYDEYVRQENLSWQQYQYQQEQQRIAQQTARADATDRAELLASLGDFSGYRALGYSDADIDLMQRVYAAQNEMPFEQGSAGGSSGAGGGRNSVKKAVSYNNSGLTSNQVQELQKYYGVTPDGLWGGGSQKAAGGLTADQAWTALQGLRQNIGMNRTEEGRVNAIQNAVNAGTLTETQAMYLLSQFNLM